MLIIGPTFAYSKRFTREHLCIRIKNKKKLRPRVNSKENFQASYTCIRPPVHARLTQVLCSKETTTILTTSNWKTNSSDLCVCKRLHWSNATRLNFSIWECNSSYYRCNLEWRKQNGSFFYFYDGMRLNGDFLTGLCRDGIVDIAWRLSTSYKCIGHIKWGSLPCPKRMELFTSLGWQVKIS